MAIAWDAATDCTRALRDRREYPMENLKTDSSSFPMKAVDGKTIENVRICKHCTAAGIEHEIVEKPHGETEEGDYWGAGVPTVRNECTGCGRWTGPWVLESVVHAML